MGSDTSGILYPHRQHEAMHSLVTTPFSPEPLSLSPLDTSQGGDTHISLPGQPCLWPGSAADPEEAEFIFLPPISRQGGLLAASAQVTALLGSSKCTALSVPGVLVMLKGGR